MTKYLVTYTYYHKAKERVNGWFIGKTNTVTEIITEHPAIWWNDLVKASYEKERDAPDDELMRGFSVYDNLLFFAEVPNRTYDHLEEL